MSRRQYGHATHPIEIQFTVTLSQIDQRRYFTLNLAAQPRIITDHDCLYKGR